MTLILVTPPTVEPVDVADVKRHARIDLADDDALVGARITAARRYIEAVTDRSFVNTTWDWVLPSFPADAFVFPRAPLASITSVKYYAAGSVLQTIWDHTANGITIAPTNQPGTLCLAPNAEWPASVDRRPDAVIVRFVSGYGSEASDVPEEVKAAILLLVTHWYEERSPVLVGTISKPLEHTLDALLNVIGHGRYV